MNTKPDESTYESSCHFDFVKGSTFCFSNGAILCQDMPFAVHDSNLSQVVFEMIEFHEDAPGAFEPLVSTASNSVIFKGCTFRNFSRPVAAVLSNLKQPHIIIFRDCHFENHVFPLTDSGADDQIVKTVFENCTFNHCFHDIERNKVLEMKSL